VCNFEQPSAGRDVRLSFTVLKLKPQPSEEFWRRGGIGVLDVTSATELLANNTDAVSLVNATGDVLGFSPLSAQLFGYQQEELVGRNIFELIHPEDREQLGRAFQDVVAHQAGPHSVKARVCRKNWEWSPVESTISNLLDEPRVAAIVIKYRDISAGSPDSQRDPSPAEDLTLDGDFERLASAMAHDLREPLRTISMFTDLLVRQVQDDKEIRPLAQFIMDGVTRVSALLDGFHSLAVAGVDELETPFDLAQVMADALENLAAAIEESGAVVTAGSMPVVRGNPNHLLRVLQNLISNAIKYRSNAPLRIAVTAAVLGPGWIIKVEDNGIGIAEEYHEFVFGFLQRLHGRDIPGTGIGLAVCRKIVEAYGGRIWVESNSGAGSTFCFTIPAITESLATYVPLSHRYLNGSPADSAGATSSNAIAQGGRIGLWRKSA